MNRLTAILIRDAATRMFWGEDGQWTPDRSQAVKFSTLESAGARTMTLESQNLEIVLRYDQPSCELVLNPVFCVSSRTL